MSKYLGDKRMELTEAWNHLTVPELVQIGADMVSHYLTPSQTRERL